VRVIRRSRSGGNAKQAVNELPMPYHITLSQPTDLPFADRMHCLVSPDRSPRSFRRSKSQACIDALLNEPVILLRDVIEVGRGPASTSPTEFARLLQFLGGANVGGMSIDVNYLRSDLRVH